jgi:hypothetical protein
MIEAEKVDIEIAIFLTKRRYTAAVGGLVVGGAIELDGGSVRRPKASAR